jgi:hypothetical protein
VAGHDDPRPGGSRHGLLNNSLYVGRLEWNRCSYVKDPSTGNRVVRPNPRKDGRSRTSRNSGSSRRALGCDQGTPARDPP